MHPSATTVITLAILWRGLRCTRRAQGDAEGGDDGVIELT
jgi:hypothetical protein